MVIGRKGGPTRQSTVCESSFYIDRLKIFRMARLIFFSFYACYLNSPKNGLESQCVKVNRTTTSLLTDLSRRESGPMSFLL